MIEVNPKKKKKGNCCIKPLQHSVLYKVSSISPFKGTQMWILFKFKFIIKLSKNASLIVCNQDQGLCAASLGHKLNELWCCWHFAGLDGSQLGSKRAVVYSHDKKKDSYTEGYFEEETPVVLMISNMFALESCETRTSVLISDTLCLWSGLLKLFLLKTKRKKKF